MSDSINNKKLSSKLYSQAERSSVAAPEMFMHASVICATYFSMSSVFPGKKLLDLLIFLRLRSSINESIAFQCLRITLHHTY